MKWIRRKIDEGDQKGRKREREVVKRKEQKKWIGRKGEEEQRKWIVRKGEEEQRKRIGRKGEEGDKKGRWKRRGEERRKLWRGRGRKESEKGEKRKEGACSFFSLSACNSGLSMAEIDMLMQYLGRWVAFMYISPHHLLLPPSNPNPSYPLFASYILLPSSLTTQ
jgi:hypothetical protein